MADSATSPQFLIEHGRVWSRAAGGEVRLPGPVTGVYQDQHVSLSDDGRYAVWNRAACTVNGSSFSCPSQPGVWLQQFG